MATTSDRIVFQKDWTVVFSCRACGSRITWRPYEVRGPMASGHRVVADPLVDRRNHQDAMMSARCPHCAQGYAKKIKRHWVLPNDRLSQVAHGYISA